MLLRCKGLDRVVAITDSIQAAGLPDGNYKLGVNDVVVKDGDAQLANGGGRAGSTLTMDCALRNLTKFNQLHAGTADPAADRKPRRPAGPARQGPPGTGLRRRLRLLDGELNVAATVVGGSVVYQA